MIKRKTNSGLRKVCGCPRRKWAKCAHSWHMNYKPRGVTTAPKSGYRLSIDAEVGKHIASKTVAQTEAIRIRAAIDDGTFRRRVEAPPPTPSTPTTTFRQLAHLWLERRGKPQTRNDVAHVNRIADFVPSGQTALGDQPVTDITEDQFEVFFANLRQQGRANGTLNKYRNFLMPMLRWGVKKGYLTRNPIADSDIIKHASERGARRRRRLAPDVVDANGKLIEAGEERRLLAAANPTLQRNIVGALETGMRYGELANLQWRDVSLARRELLVRAETSKTRTSRVVIISAKLAAMLDMARIGPDGKDRDPLDYVFGDEAGRKLGSYKKTWATTVLKAHGHTPKWAEHGKLSPESRTRLRSIDLHFHDLRHEAGSRLIETGTPIHEVREQLGHASLQQTSTYLNATLEGRKASMRRADELRNGCKPVANEGGIEHPLPCNDEEDVTPQPRVN